MEERNRDFRSLAAISEQVLLDAMSGVVNHVDDPRTSGARTGDAAEQIAEWLGEKCGLPRNNKGTKRTESTADYLTRLEICGHLTRSVASSFHRIRSFRNKCSHRDSVTSEGAEKALDLLEGITRWLEREHGLRAPTSARPSQHDASKPKRPVPPVDPGRSNDQSSQSFERTWYVNSKADVFKQTLPPQVADEPVKPATKPSPPPKIRKIDDGIPLKMFITPKEADEGGTLRLCEADGSTGWVNIPPHVIHLSLLKRKTGGDVIIVVGPTHKLYHNGSRTSVEHIISTTTAKFGGSSVVHTPVGKREISIPPATSGVNPHIYSFSCKIPQAGVLKEDGSRFDLDVLVSAVGTADVPQEGDQQKPGMMKRIFGLFDD